MKRRCLLALLMFLVAACGLCEKALAQDEVMLTPVKDNTLYEDEAGAVSNGAGDHLFAGLTREEKTRRALLAFDVAGALPEGAVLDRVELTLHLSRTIGEAESVALYRVLADWGEGTSNPPENSNEGGGAAATAGDATWIHTFFDTDFWQNPGGDFEPEASASTLVAGEGDYTWSTPEMGADVQAWLDAPEENFGWVLLGNEEAALSAKRFDSRDNPDAAVRPVLRLFYSVPTAIETEEEPALPRLVANYPNPFRQVTTISYVLRTPQPVTLEVYDVLGRNVATLVDGRQPAGPHEASFDASGLPGGVYVYRLSARGFYQYRTMVVLR